MTHYQLIDGRISSRADQLAPERCQRCGYRGASLAPNGTGALVCSLCDPDGWDIPRAPKRAELDVRIAAQRGTWPAFQRQIVRDIIEQARQDSGDVTSSE
ncbi:hypothetical protein [Mycobacteroides abscessus]|uniref:hypothetical protein n=1 Tax=Mycobacteroides abscessus TaxID=36809 RepID=UPI000928AFBC|nr:hypothetical protein [Mycobacteroides abscessus]SHW96634.1 Uncharacterised protein [Mycobacteroides abscessus subsp. abscessus]SHZ44782.1 Uncharacterised protein [Mycobacteroides abscessus subsp. abscessus]SIB80130.1 Uncharacterised protein [Mycobacteroides abscessus subsp. abscessus]SIE55263.1 Uncharacterised protein [Mycobacteroides abscessus subsp. abscessus]SKI35843.1 Uncharacterised protein [Mycobacteroides abscessus subsp. abscessus]